MTDKSDKKQVSEGEKIWNEVKERTIDIFALPNQKVSDHSAVAEAFFVADPAKLYLTLRSSAALPAIEEALKKHFTVSQVDKWITISRK